MSDTRLFIKWLRPDGRPAHGGRGKWPLPTRNADGTWTPGDPLTVSGPIIPCQNGLHLCRLADAPRWISGVPYLAQYRGEMVEVEDKVVVREARLLGALIWTDREQRLFACDCAERALSRIPTADPRSHEAVRVARLFAQGKATEALLSAAWSAAESAWRAAESAWSAARSAAESAAWSAESAARSAAESAAWSAAWSAARSAEYQWQGERLWLYFSGTL